MVLRWVVAMGTAAMTGAGLGATFLMAPGEEPAAFSGRLHHAAVAAPQAALRALSGKPSPRRAQPPPPTDAGQAHASREERLPRLRANLLGTVLTADPAESLALIQDLTRPQRPQREVRVGETVQGRTLARIGRAEAWLRRPDGIEERLAMAEGDGASRPMIQPIGPRAFRVHLRQLARHVKGNVRQLLAQVKIRPILERFQVVGFEVAEIQPGSILHEAGIKARDVVKAVNGIALDGMQHARAAYHAARTSREVTMEISRQGRTETLSYVLD